MINTKQSVEEAKRYYDRLKNNYISIFRMLFHNCVIVKNLPSELPKRYLLRQLLNKGSIAYDKISKLYLPYVGINVDNYGLPTQYQVYGYRGFNAIRSIDEVVILRCNDLSYPISQYLELQAEKLADIDVSIKQNLDNNKVTTIVKVGNKSTLLTLSNINYARQIGSSVVYADKDIINDTFDKVDTNVQYLVDRLLENRKVILNETLSVLGIASSNTDKRERVQSTEVIASFAFAKSMIDTLIDTFNYDAEVGGLDIRLENNTSTVEIEQILTNKQGAENEK